MTMNLRESQFSVSPFWESCDCVRNCVSEKFDPESDSANERLRIEHVFGFGIAVSRGENVKRNTGNAIDSFAANGT